jgi:hypothetical protein
MEITSQFYWGLGIGFAFGVIGMILITLRLWESSRDVRRLKRNLADKLELEAHATNRLRSDLEDLKQQNENLRIKVANLNQLPERRLNRDLEIYARAERYMVARSPGFPAVWEEAKRAAASEVEVEEQGQSLPRRVFNALLKNRDKTQRATEAVPEMDGREN